ncbi:MAG: hypothetical protein AAF616_01215 [Bacteroidota bacterium]
MDVKSTLDKKYAGYLREGVNSVQTLLKSGNKNQKKFVLFGRGRSGSSLLTDILNSSDQIFCDKEILNRPVLNAPKFIENRRKFHKTDLYGFKLLSYQLREIVRTQDPRAFLHHLVLSEGYKMVFMSRRNLLRQTLSKHYSRFRNEWHSTNAEVKRPMMKVDIQLLLKHLGEGEDLALFEKNVIDGLEYFEIVYEDDLATSASQKEVVDRLSSYLGVEKFAFTNSYKKITGEHISDFVNNYGELESALKSTRHHKYLED